MEFQVFPWAVATERNTKFPYKRRQSPTLGEAVVCMVFCKPSQFARGDGLSGWLQPGQVFIQFNNRRSRVLNTSYQEEHLPVIVDLTPRSCRANHVLLGGIVHCPSHKRCHDLGAELLMKLLRE
eukprot:183993-Amphidinium_carterae.1